MNTITIKIEGLKELLSKGLVIPPYQRPYSWTEKQVEPLLQDLSKRQTGDILIMGGVILHKDEKGYLNIVDGQQRLITYTIIDKILGSGNGSDLLSYKFEHKDSVTNISSNAQFIKYFTDKRGHEKFSIDNIYFIVVTTNDLSDAFTFFDTQNTRGKSLESYDILKAHHLRFIKDNDLATMCANDWERIEKDDTINMGVLLETFLSRGRNWSSNVNAMPDIREEFKSQRTSKKDVNAYLLNRYQQAPLFNSWKYNPTEKKAIEYQFEKVDATYKVGSLVVNDDIYKFIPFQITQTIEGGELFFWYTQKYHILVKELFSKNNTSTSNDFKQLLEMLNHFTYNTGFVYCAEVFKGALLFYFDKFGYQQLDEVACTLFYSIFWLRMKQGTVQYASIYKYIREEFNPFSLIKDASFPDYLVSQCDGFLEGKYKVFERKKGIRGTIYSKLEKEEINLLKKHYLYQIINPK